MNSNERTALYETIADLAVEAYNNPLDGAEYAAQISEALVDAGVTDQEEGEKILAEIPVYIVVRNPSGYAPDPDTVYAFSIPGSEDTAEGLRERFLDEIRGYYDDLELEPEAEAAVKELISDVENAAPSQFLKGEISAYGPDIPGLGGTHFFSISAASAATALEFAEAEILLPNDGNDVVPK